jgi:biofilm PGA synthesis N-glycosyltransferase PgaC
VLILPSYVLITPARNEVQFIELVIQSVVAQTARPLKWIIVSDGSIDGTDEVVQKYSAKHEWIELVRMPNRSDRHFAGKVYAFNAGLARVVGLSYEVIASLDADISFDEDYFAFLLEKLTEEPALGLVGTPYKDVSSDIYDYRYVSAEDVSGACQVFRRSCFEAIGGYMPVKGGAVDTIAALTARMQGWKTRTFPEKICLHHRKQGTALCGPIHARFDEGVKDYALGNHPIWQMFRVVYQMTKRPVVLRGLAIGVGFLWASLRRFDRPISRELVRFRRREEMQRLVRALTRQAHSSKDSALSSDITSAEIISQTKHL